MSLDPEHGGRDRIDPAPPRFDWSRVSLNEKTFLHVGCGPARADKINRIFRGWREVRLDIDPGVQPDIIACLTSMTDVPDNIVDGLWSSHSVEHLFAHQVPLAFREFHRVLKPGGTMLVTMPDLEAACQWIVDGKSEVQVPGVKSTAPITPMDMIYGWRHPIAKGRIFMAHRTGFTSQSLGGIILRAGFPQVQMRKGNMLDLWAIAKKGRNISDPQELVRAMNG